MGFEPSPSDESSEATLSALLAHLPKTAKPECFQEIIPKFFNQLKTDFENRSLWLRFGLALSLSKESPQSALQAFNECMRIDQDDPLPTMLAAKILLEDLDDPEQALIFAKEAIKRCKNMTERLEFHDLEPIDKDTPLEDDHIEGASTEKVINGSDDCHQDARPILTRSYVLASIAHAYIYEREPESIKKPFKEENLRTSLKLLDMACETNPDDYLVYFHKALHDAKQRNYPKALDNLRRSIQLNPQHIQSMQLLILSLSALKLYDDALNLCESILKEQEDDLILLYIKCNLEQNLVETKGYKVALITARHMLKCIRQSTNNMSEHRNYSSTTTISATTQHAGTHHNQHNQSCLMPGAAAIATTTTTSTITTTTNAHSLSPMTVTNAFTAQGSANNTTVGSIAGSTVGSTSAPIPIAPATIPTSLSNPVGDIKQKSNLFAEDTINSKRRSVSFSEGELSIWILVAEIFIKIGAVDDAELCVDEGASHSSGPLSFQVMFIRGLIAKAKNHLMEAKTFFQSCLALCPRHAKALQQIAHVYYLMGNFPTAEKFLKDSLDLDCDCHKTWYYLSLVYIEMNQHDRASECVKKSSCLEESSPVVSLAVISRLVLK